MSWTDNPIDDFLRHDDERERWLKRRPRCRNCGDHIQDETAYHFDDGWLCADCIKEFEQYIEDDY